MAAANAKLDEQIQQSPETYNIENVSDSDERVIEMVSNMQTVQLSERLMPLGSVLALRASCLNITQKWELNYRYFWCLFVQCPACFPWSPQCMLVSKDNKVKHF